MIAGYGRERADRQHALTGQDTRVLPPSPPSDGKLDAKQSGASGNAHDSIRGFGTTLRDTGLLFILSTAGGVVAALVLLMIVNTLLLRIPVRTVTKPPAAATVPRDARGKEGKDYRPITERNFFRAKLEAEMVKPRTKVEIEEERLSGILKTMSLRGVMVGQQKEDFYAVIDRGGQKGIWTYQLGDGVEAGLTVTDILKDAVIVKEGDFVARLKLFAQSFEWISKPQTATLASRKKEPPEAETAMKGQKPADYTNGISRSGTTLVISHSLAEMIERDNSLIASSVAIKPVIDEKGQPNGYQIVSVDKGSLAEKIGITPNDTVLEINGFRLGSAQEQQKAYEALKDSSRFAIKVLRGGRIETLQYEIQ